jgi:hypothetical protein
MVSNFRFVADGLAYTCSTGQAHPPQRDSWWWFVVAGDRQRYAPFRSTAGDTQESVRSRVVEFYSNRLARLAEPPERRGFGGHRFGRQAGVPADAAVPPVESSEAHGRSNAPAPVAAEA